MPIRRNPTTGQLEKVSDIAIEAENQARKEAPSQPINALLGKNHIADIQDATELNDLNSPEAAPAIDKMVRYTNQLKTIQASIDKAANDNPALWGGLTGIGSKPTLDVLANTGKAVVRALSIGTNFQVGVMQGLLNMSQGKGTFWDGFSGSFKKNESNADILKRLNVPEGPSVQPHVLDVLSPSSGLMGRAAEIATKKDTDLLKPFGPKVTARGAVGLAADIILDPLTYLTLGSSVPAKAATKAGAKPVATWFNKVLLNDKQLSAGFKALRSSKAGHAMYDVIDRFAGHNLVKGLSNVGKEVKDVAGSAFIPDYGMFKPVADLGRKVEKEIFTNEVGIRKSFGKLKESFNDDEVKEMFYELFSANKLEGLFGKGNLGKVPLSNSKYQAAYDKMHETVRGLAKSIGMPEEILYENYVPSIFKEIEENSFKKGGNKFLRVGTSKGSLKKEFVENNKLVRDPFEAFADRAVELMRIERINNGFIKKVVSDYGASLEQATKQGFDEFFPLDVRKTFKGTSFEKAAMNETFLQGSRTKELDEIVTKAGFKDRADVLAKMHLIKQGKDAFLRNRGELTAKIASENFKKLRKQVKSLGPEAINAIRGRAELARKPVYLPNKIVKTIEDLGARNKVVTNDLLRVYDDFTNKFWKAAQTSIFPAFHFRNNTNNLARRFAVQGVKGLNPVNDVAALKIVTGSADLGSEILETKAGKKYTLAKVKKLMAKAGVLDNSGQVAEVLKDLDRRVPHDAMIGNLTRALDSFSSSQVVESAREIGRAIENHGKAAVFIQALRDGFSAKEATQLAHTALFDYAHITPFERNVMKRLFPFYTFARKNLQAQFETLVQHPGRQAAVAKIAKEVSDEAYAGLTPEQREAFNEVREDFLQNSGAIPVGIDKQGNPLWMTGLGIGQEDLIDLAGDTQGSLLFRTNPLIKAAGNSIFEFFAERKGIALKDRYDIAEVKDLYKLQGQDVEKFINSEDFQTSPLTKLLGLRVVELPVFQNGKRTGDKRRVLQADKKVVGILKDLLISRAMSTGRILSNPNIDEQHKFAQFTTGIGFYKSVVDRSVAIKKNQLQEKLGLEAKQAGQGGSLDNVFIQDPALKNTARQVNKLRYQ